MRSRIVAATVFLAWMSCGAADAQVLLSKSWDEPVSLDLDNAATKRLASIEDIAADRQWDVVANLLRQAQTEQGDKLIPIAPGWYVSVARYCQCRAAVLPPAGLTAYRSLADSGVSAWLTDARKSDDRAAWLRIARRGFAASHGSEAIRRLAEQSFELGDFAAARTWWELLLPAEPGLRAAAGVGLLRQPAGSANEAEIRAALILCSLFENDTHRAELELAVFRQKHADARSRLGVQEGALSELLAEKLAQSRSRAVALETRTIPEIAGVVWSQTLPAPIWSNSILVANRELPGSFWPSVTERQVFASNGDVVLGWELADGRSAWSSNHQPEPSTAQNVIDDEEVIYEIANPLAPKLPIQGHVLQKQAVHNHRLYARLGSPISGRAKTETEFASELIGLDIGSGEGKLVWRVSTDEIDPADPLRESSPWCFDGSPVANDEHVFAVIRRSLPQEEIQVACFDADSARLKWKKKLGVTITATPENVNTASHSTMTLLEDSLFVSTDEGVIAAFEQSDGAIRWLRTVSDNSPGEPRDQHRQGFAPPLLHRGTLYAVARNGSQLMAIHAESGLLCWQHDWPEPIQFLVGIGSKTLIVSGRNLWGVRLSDGRPAWPLRRVGDDDSEGWSAGRGVVCGDSVLWPTREELLVVSTNSGAIQRRIPIQSRWGISGGDLFLRGNHLLVSRDRSITALKLEPERQR